ncbi:hypothetical protein F9C28_13130 [Shimwellia pseudoproteus]|uniref:hypothetical protein n=1 Tax=Shimwellia pseudoproteus TaxID=570012 RepID=UPI0018ED8189|nr:hypothetical protein [Shimwellia pseudoproteus]MBJ3815850.1 hypothetical protein [Shimwellia pseudoproteus]
MNTAVLRVQLDETLKEKVREYAELHSQNLSQATGILLGLAFQHLDSLPIAESDIDNQHTQEAIVEDAGPLTSKEIKSLRKLLKRRK